MCGIAGWIGAPEVADSILIKMTGAQAHRGPDADGQWHGDGTHLGHRRLSIIDLAGSVQPMASPDGRAVLTFNGEIYNYRELRAELEALGQSFRTSGDTEVLLGAWLAWGEACVERLQGMFAFAIWDRPSRTLFLARDHLGVKPLVYWCRGSTLAFASELKGLRAFPGLPRAVDFAAVSLYLEKQYVPGPYTIWQGVRKLPPGHCLTWRDGQLNERRYWHPRWQPELDLAGSEAVEALDAELRRSVASMLVADVPLGAFLSGGVDSSTVVALMTAVRGRGIDTFDLGFAGGFGSEHAEAEQVARHLGCTHHPLMIEPRDVLAEIDGLHQLYDEPFGDQAALPTLLLARLTRRHVTVVLTGEGADEIFAGYGTYAKRLRELAWCRQLAGRGSPLPALLRCLPGGLRKGRLLGALSRREGERYASMPGQIIAELHRAWFTPAFLAARTVTAAQLASANWRDCDGDDLDRLLWVDTRMWLPDDLLTKVDIATMAASLEARVPYLDHRLVEFAARLKPEHKTGAQGTKVLLKQVAERYLPRELVHRAKSGFTMPLGQWLNQGLAGLLDDCLGEGGLLRRGLINAGPLRRMIAQHRAGRSGRGFRLWTLMMLELWFRRHAPDFRLG